MRILKMNNFYSNGIEIFRKGFNDFNFLDDLNLKLSKIKELDLFNSVSKFPVTNEVSNVFKQSKVISDILKTLCPEGYEIMAEWFLNKKSFLPTHRDAVFFPYHHKDLSLPIKHKICKGSLFSRIYFNIMVFITEEQSGYEYFYVPNTHILDEKMYSKYFKFGVYYQDNNPFFSNSDDTSKTLLATGCTKEEYDYYNPLIEKNKKNLVFPNIKKGDIILQSGSLIHGSLGELPNNKLSNNFYRKSYILRVCSNEYFKL